jgi:molybdate transport system substrate-binding protein
MFRPLILTLFVVANATILRAEEVTVAVAANFAAPMQKIAQLFQQDTGHMARLSFGATGSFYAQIKNGAPFQVFLSADATTAEKLEAEGLGLAGTRFIYATGQLVLWSPQPELVDEKGRILQRKEIQRIAMANPKLAPYGAAAMETITHLGLLKDLQPKLVLGDNIAQTYQFVMTQNVPIGFVSLSQVFINGKIGTGSAWIVPAHYYKPLRQEAILLKNAKDHSAAKALMLYLRGEKARSVMKSFGYLTD